MNKIIIPVIAGILILSIGLSQDVYAPNDQPEKLTLGGTGYTKAIPDWVKNQFQWYVNGEIEEGTLLTSMNWLFDNNIMHLSEKAAKETQELRAENEKLRSMVGATKSETMGSMKDDSTTDGDPDRPVIVGSVPNEASKDMVLKASKIKENVVDAKLRPLRDVIVLGTATHGIVDNIIKNGGTESAWKKGISSFGEHGMQESVVDDLQGIVVLCNTEIDKKTQTIDAELAMIEEWLKIIQEKETATGTSDRMATAPTGTTKDSTVQHRQSDLDFITRKLGSIDQQINSLDTGLSILEQKLQTAGDDAQLANIDLQNILQKQQQTLQTMSNVSKMLHDTAKAIIQNMKA